MKARHGTWFFYSNHVSCRAGPTGVETMSEKKPPDSIGRSTEELLGLIPIRPTPASEGIDDVVANAHALIKKFCEPLSDAQRAVLMRRVILDCSCSGSFGMEVFKQLFDNSVLVQRLNDRDRKPSTENQRRDEALWEEKKTKSWEQLFASHLDEEEGALRSAVRRHAERLKRLPWAKPRAR
jgi:hypothetical protein